MPKVLDNGIVIWQHNKKVKARLEGMRTLEIIRHDLIGFGYLRLVSTIIGRCEPNK